MKTSYSDDILEIQIVGIIQPDEIRFKVGEIWEAHPGIRRIDLHLHNLAEGQAEDAWRLVRIFREEYSTATRDLFVYGTCGAAAAILRIYSRNAYVAPTATVTLWESDEDDDLRKSTASMLHHCTAASLSDLRNHMTMPSALAAKKLIDLGLFSEYPDEAPPRPKVKPRPATPDPAQPTPEFTLKFVNEVMPSRKEE